MLQGLSNGEAMYTLLCKPVSVNIVELSSSEIQRWTKSNSSNQRCNDPLMQETRKTTRRNSKYVKRSERNREIKRILPGDNGSIEKLILPARRRSATRNANEKGLMQTIRQPYVKLKRIDEVINKIALSFAKVISHREEKTCTEFVAPKPSEALKASESLASSSSYDECIERNPSPNITNDSSVSENPKLYTYTDSNSSDDFNIFKSQRKRRFKRIKRIISDSDSNSDNCEVNSDVEKVTSRRRKRLKSNAIEQNVGTCISNEENNVTKRKSLDENQTPQIESCQGSDNDTEMGNTFYHKSLCAQQNVDISQHSSSVLDNISVSFSHDGDEDNSSTYVPSELNSTHTRNSNIPQQLENDNLSTVGETIQESISLDKSLIEEYKLFKELRVSLIRLDSLRNFVDSKYSASEIEQLTGTYLNFLRNSNFLIPSIVYNSPNGIESTSLNINTSSTEKHDITEKAASSSKTFLPFPEEEEIVQESENLHAQKACSDLTKYFENNSRCLEQTSIPPPSETSILQSSQEASSKRMESLNIDKKTLDTEKSENFSCTKFNKSTLEGEMLKKCQFNMSSQKKVGTSTSDKIINSSSESAKLFLSQQNEKSLASGKILQPARANKTLHTKKYKMKKSSAGGYSSIISPVKDNKLGDGKDKKCPSYKCIVCDVRYDSFATLKQHLVSHTQKHNITLTSSKDSMVSHKDQETLELTQSLDHNYTKQLAPEILNTSPKRKKNKHDTLSKRSSNKERKKGHIKNDFAEGPSTCTICSHVFETKPDLAAHIFLHTEAELQEAFRLARQRLQQNDTQFHEGKDVEKEAEQTNHKTNSDLPRTSETISEMSKDKGSLLRTQLEKEKVNKGDNNKKNFTVCECHNQPGTDGDCLQIEIVYLCHTCRVLFRSVECFETHFRLSQHATCKDRCNRSPNLFCATCGMVFSSVQDVRHHLEIHARFRKNCTMDFRCNVCKVIFVGIGSQFYVHWSKHAKDPLWIASELSFPKDSILAKKIKEVDKFGRQIVKVLNKTVDGYIQIAEHICKNCKTPFTSENNLKQHLWKCNSFNSTTDDTALLDSNTDDLKLVPLKIVCSLCDNTFTERNKFYKHIMDVHKLNGETQFICISLRTMKRAYICSICMDITENLNQFEDHWLNHSTQDVVFTCTCGKACHSNIQSFIAHAKEHNLTNGDVLSCTASYENTKTICKQCNIGFKSAATYTYHANIHKMTSAEVGSKENDVLNLIDKVYENSEPVSGRSEYQPERSEETSHEPTAETTKECPTTSNVNNDKESLIRILEGNDDSEHELIIDLGKEQVENAGSPVKESIEEIQYIVNCIPNNDTCTPPSEETFPVAESLIATETMEDLNDLIPPENVTVTQMPQLDVETATVPEVTQSVTVPPPEVINLEVETLTSDPEALDTETEKSENVGESSTKPVEEEQINDSNHIDLTENDEEPSALQNIISVIQSPQKAGKGFIRVKPLAELLASPKIPDSTAENSDNLIEHSECDKTTEEHYEKNEAAEERLPMENFVNLPPGPGKNGASSLSHAGSSMPVENSKASAASVPSATKLTCVSRKPIARTMQINKRDVQKLQEIINRARQQSSTSARSAYHKNLPACNFVRTTTAEPRYSTQRGENSSPDTVRKAANTQNVHNAHGEQNVPNVQNVQSSMSVQPAQVLQNAQGVQHAQVFQNAQGVQHAQVFQNTQSMQHAQVLQNAQNMQDAQRLQNSQSMHNIQRLDNAQSTQNSEGLQNAQSMMDTQKLYKETPANGRSTDATCSNNVANNNSDKVVEYSCEFCHYRGTSLSEYLMHSLPGTNSTCKLQYVQQRSVKNQEQPNVTNAQAVNSVNGGQNNVNHTQCQQTVINQGIPSSSVCYQYPYHANNSSNKHNEMFQQNQQIIATQPIAATTTSSIYYENSGSSSGGMAIVINNQTAPTVQGIPTIGILQQPVQPQIYQPPVYTDPITMMDSSCMQEQQNLVDFTDANNVYQMANDSYNMPHGDTAAATYGVRLESPTVVCPYCPKTISFVSNNQLEVHLNSNHNFVCHLCNLRLYNFGQWTAHRHKHNLL